MKKIDWKLVVIGTLIGLSVWQFLNPTIQEVEKKIKIDGTIIRHLTVKYKKLDTENEFFKKE